MVMIGATKFILGFPNGEMSYEERLVKLNLIPLSYRHEMKDLLFLHIWLCFW